PPPPPPPPPPPAELGRESSRHIGRLVPHDGYMLAGLDPVTGAGCLFSGENTYSLGALDDIVADEPVDADVRPYAALRRSPAPVGVLGSGGPEDRHSAVLHDVMAREGFGGQMRLVLVSGGVLWGTLTLVRERGRPHFSAAEVARAQQLVAPMTMALKRFVRRTAPRPVRSPRPPGVLVIGDTSTIRTATATAGSWLGIPPGPGLPDDPVALALLWHITFMTRRLGEPVLNRVPTADGWVEMHAQPVCGPRSGEVAITLQPTSARTLLPAVAAWYGVTPAEVAVIQEALQGLPAKLIARRLGVSPHTVNDHLKAVYRKLGVGSREELIASLST
ncbi:helix-turn-helix transcriptional regulator, partial [Streptomyces sp. URMC 129]|uniref:helix-turn-helix transcriptional regulator n=1 Tax=Streptomyces sp. URMC 129 TaxID=3423407 RepID=UPI003F1993B9